MTPADYVRLWSEYAESYLTYKDAWGNGAIAPNGVGNYPNSEIDMTTYPNGSGNLLAYASGLSHIGQTFTDYNYCQIRYEKALSQHETAC